MPAQAGQKILVIIPARNEGGSIGSIISEVKRLHPGFDILVIDDASTDRTGDAAKEAGARVLRAPINLGYGGAVQAGFKYAHRHTYDMVILMDADGQHDPAYIDKLVEASAELDLVVGSRFTGQATYRIPLIRLIGMRVFSGIASAITRRRITDTSSGFQAMRREVFTMFALGSYPVDFPDADTLIWVARHGFRVGEVPVEMHERQAGTSMISGLSSSLKYALKMPLSIFVTILRIPSRQKGEDTR